MSESTRKRYEIPIEEPKPGTRHIPLTQAKIAVIDEQDYERVSRHKWYAAEVRSGYWYARTRMKIDGKWKTVSLHRFILNPPPDKVVDHINHDRLNCTRENMRICTRRENSQNVQGRKAKLAERQKDRTLTLGQLATVYGVIADMYLDMIFEGRSQECFLAVLAQHTQDMGLTMYIDDESGEVVFDNYHPLHEVTL